MFISRLNVCISFYSEQNVEPGKTRCEDRKFVFARKKKKTWITVRFLFDVEHAGSSIEKRVGHKCTVGRLVLVLPLLVTHVARVGAVEEKNMSLT